MKKFQLIMLVLALVVMTTPVLAGDVAVKAGVDLNSAYVWRGITFNDGVVVQPWVDVSKNGFGINVWANYDVDDYDGMMDENEFSEIDFTVSYSLPVELMDVGVGYINYQLPTGGDAFQEGFLSIGKKLGEAFFVGLDFYLDLDDGHFTYTVLKAGYGRSLTESLTLDIDASAAYAGGGYTADGDAGFHDYRIGLSLGYDITENWLVSASLAYTDAIDDDKLADGVFAHDVDVYGGVGIACTF